LLRDVAHLLDTAALFVGWLWPLWDGRNRTFADLLLRTECHVVEPARRNVRQTAGIVFLVAALLCAAGCGLGYQSVYRYDRAVEKTRTEIAAQGPRIVEQMLSYGTGTVKDDFARAQSLATDGYRSQLIDQQQVSRRSARPPTNTGPSAAPSCRRRQIRPGCCWRCRVSAVTIEQPEVHHGDGPGGVRTVGRRPLARRQPHGPEEAADERAGPMSPRRQIDTAAREYFTATPTSAAVGASARYDVGGPRRRGGTHREHLHGGRPRATAALRSGTWKPSTTSAAS
jgi:hypothetical protein